MTKNEIARYPALGRAKSVCMDVSLPKQYPRLMRMIHFCFPREVVFVFEPTGAVCGDLGYKHLARDHHELWLQHMDDEIIEYE